MVIRFQITPAMFHIAMLKEHPELPPNISAEANNFLLKCLVPDPKERDDAKTLLKHPFVSQVTLDSETSVSSLSLEPFILNLIIVFYKRNETAQMQINALEKLKTPLLVNLSAALLPYDILVKMFSVKKL